MYFNPILRIENNENGYGEDIISNLFAKRIIFLTGEVSDELATTIISQLIYLDYISHDEIKLYINSQGGVVSAGLSIIDTMKYIKSDVNVVVIGMAASIAAVIAACGTKGKRCCLENADLMIHEPSTSCMGTATSIINTSRRIENIRTRIYKILSEATNQDISVIEHDCLQDSYFTAEEAIEYGLIDKVIIPNK